MCVFVYYHASYCIPCLYVENKMSSGLYGVFKVFVVSLKMFIQMFWYHLLSVFPEELSVKKRTAMASFQCEEYAHLAIAPTMQLIHH